MIDECLKVTFEVKHDGCPLSDASESIARSIVAQPPQLRSDGNVLLKFSAPTNDGLRQILDEDPRIHLLHIAESDDHDIFRCLSDTPCVIHTLVDAGLLVETLQYREGTAEFSGTIVDREVLKNVVERPDDSVNVKLQNITLIRSESGEPPDRPWKITDRQEECLRTAVRMGYFELPREVTPEEVAQELGIGKSAFFERLRRAQRDVFEGILP